MGDLQQQGTRDAERRHCQRSQPRHRKTSASVYITGKRCDAKVSRTVWREADGKGLQSRVPRWRPTLPNLQWWNRTLTVTTPRTRCYHERAVRVSRYVLFA